MKRTLIASLLAIATGSAIAQPFDFQRQFGSSEYVPGADTAHLRFEPVVESGTASSLSALMLASDVDGIAPNRFVGDIVASGPTRISLYEVQRGSPEATAYRAYYERFPTSGWSTIAGNDSAGAVDAS
ncbi:MAG: hypothetical protein H6955_01350 [Chromatiaceae bacterium]|nr:hypothetical protein [Chromatiaceae bacterium]